MKSVFPFKVYPIQYEKYVSNYRPFQKYVVDMAKRNDFAWYAYAVEFKNRTNAEVVVFGIKDSYFGGIGREIFRFDVACDDSESDEAVNKQASRMAAAIRERQIQDYENKKIDAIKDRILEFSFS